jgi:hypothetical protein
VLPLNLGHETLEEFGIEFSFSYFNFNILELERKVVRVAFFDVTSKKIVRYQADHDSYVQDATESLVDPSKLSKFVINRAKQRRILHG